MAVAISEQLSALPQLRYQPIHKRVRVALGGETVAESVRPVLVWEPMRIVSDYAVPEADLGAGLAAATPGPAPDYRPVGFGNHPPLLDPSVPFAVHTAAGEPLTTTAGDRTGATFRPADLR